MASRILAIGDVHGCDRALGKLLKMVAPAPEDTLIFLGDLIDRGPESRQAIERLVELQSVCRVVLLLGNHEEVMRSALSSSGYVDFWLTIGGRATLDSYGGNAESIPPAHIKLLVTARDFFETETEIFVHAGLEADVSLVNQTADFLRWKHLGGSERPHSSGKRIICGHTPQLDGRPLVLDGWVCIDTFAYSGKWLTCLDVATNEIWQASQGGETRRDRLPKIP